MAGIERRNGKWRARIYVNGVERSRTFDRKVDAERWAATQRADVARGQWIDPALGRITFAEWSEVWKESLYELRPTTLALNLGVLRNHLLPRFGRVQIARITLSDVRKMVADDAAGYSPSATRRHVFVLRGVLDAAVEEGRIARNVAAAVKLPPDRSRPMRFLEPAEVLRLADSIRPAHYRPLVLTAAWVGLRQGELFGLAIDRVDLLRRTILVERQLIDVSGRLQFGPPKTGAGVRTVTLPGVIADVLGEHFASEPCQNGERTLTALKHSVEIETAVCIHGLPPLVTPHRNLRLIIDTLRAMELTISLIRRQGEHAGER